MSVLETGNAGYSILLLKCIYFVFINIGGLVPKITVDSPTHQLHGISGRTVLYFSGQLSKIISLAKISIIRIIGNNSKG